MADMSRWGPKLIGIRDPRDPKQKFSLFWNWARYLAIGGKSTGGNLNRAIETDPQLKQDRETKAGPISDRGRGGRS